jgi:hypothetical protein
MIKGTTGDIYRFLWRRGMGYITVSRRFGGNEKYFLIYLFNFKNHIYKGK